MTKAYRKGLVKMKIKNHLIFKVMSLLQNKQMKKYKHPYQYNKRIFTK
jgi:hypothetical protein